MLLSSAALKSLLVFGGKWRRVMARSWWRRFPRERFLGFWMVVGGCDRDGRAGVVAWEVLEAGGGAAVERL